MSEKQEHRWRYILRLQYIAQMETWESREPKLPPSPPAPSHLAGAESVEKLAGRAAKVGGSAMQETVMKEYIEREAVKAVFDGIYDCADMVFEPNDHCCSADDCGRCKWAQTKNAIKKMVMAIPTADVVEVVRCGECKHMVADGTCKVFADDNIFPSASDYCSYGERKGGADDV